MDESFNNFNSKDFQTLQKFSSVVKSKKVNIKKIIADASSPISSINFFTNKKFEFIKQKYKKNNSVIEENTEDFNSLPVTEVLNRSCSSETSISSFNSNPFIGHGVLAGPINCLTPKNYSFSIPDKRSENVFVVSNGSNSPRKSSTTSLESNISLNFKKIKNSFIKRLSVDENASKKDNVSMNSARYNNNTFSNIDEIERESINNSFQLPTFQTRSMSQVFPTKPQINIFTNTEILHCKSSAQLHKNSSKSQSHLSKRDHVMNVLKELVNTERTYVKDLKDIIQGYYRPLKKQGVLSSDDLDLIFSNIVSIYKLNRRFLRLMLENEKSAVGLCRLFINNHKDFSIYTSYCTNYAMAQQRLQWFTNRPHTEACKAIEECQKNLQHLLPLTTFLFKPIQRITKYHLLFKSLLEKYDELMSSSPTLTFNPLSPVRPSYPPPPPPSSSLMAQPCFYTLDSSSPSHKSFSMYSSHDILSHKNNNNNNNIKNNDNNKCFDCSSLDNNLEKCLLNKDEETFGDANVDNFFDGNYHCDEEEGGCDEIYEDSDVILRIHGAFNGRITEEFSQEVFNGLSHHHTSDTSMTQGVNITNIIENSYLTNGVAEINGRANDNCSKNIDKRKVKKDFGDCNGHESIILQDSNDGCVINDADDRGDDSTITDHQSSSRVDTFEDDSSNHNNSLNNKNNHNESLNNKNNRDSVKYKNNDNSLENKNIGSLNNTNHNTTSPNNNEKIKIKIEKYNDNSFEEDSHKESSQVYPAANGNEGPNQLNPATNTDEEPTRLNSVVNGDQKVDERSVMVMAHECMKRLAHDINEEKRAQELKEKMILIENCVVGDRRNELKCMGDLIHEGTLVCLGLVREEVQVLLKVGGMVVLKRRRDRGYTVKSIIKKCNLVLTESIRNQPSCFRILMHNKGHNTLTFQAESIEAKRQWCDRIKRLILQSFDSILSERVWSLVMGQTNSKENDKNDLKCKKTLNLSNYKTKNEFISLIKASSPINNFLNTRKNELLKKKEKRKKRRSQSYESLRLLSEKSYSNFYDNFPTNNDVFEEERSEQSFSKENKELPMSELPSVDSLSRDLIQEFDRNLHTNDSRKVLEDDNDLFVECIKYPAISKKVYRPAQKILVGGNEKKQDVRMMESLESRVTHNDVLKGVHQSDVPSFCKQVLCPSPQKRNSKLLRSFSMTLSNSSSSHFDDEEVTEDYEFISCLDDIVAEAVNSDDEPPKMSRRGKVNSKSSIISLFSAISDSFKVNSRESSCSSLNLYTADDKSCNFKEFYHKQTSVDELKVNVSTDTEQSFKTSFSSAIESPDFGHIRESFHQNTSQYTDSTLLDSLNLSSFLRQSSRCSLKRNEAFYKRNTNQQEKQQESLQNSYSTDGNQSRNEHVFNEKINYLEVSGSERSSPTYDRSYDDDIKNSSRLSSTRSSFKSCECVVTNVFDDGAVFANIPESNVLHGDRPDGLHDRRSDHLLPMACFEDDDDDYKDADNSKSNLSSYYDLQNSCNMDGACKLNQQDCLYVDSNDDLQNSKPILQYLNKEDKERGTVFKLIRAYSNRIKQDADEDYSKIHKVDGENNGFIDKELKSGVLNKDLNMPNFNETSTLRIFVRSNRCKMNECNVSNVDKENDGSDKPGLVKERLKKFQFIDKSKAFS